VNDQVVFNWVFTIAGALGGWILKFLYDGLKELQDADHQLVAKVQAVELLVAGQYVRRTELEKLSEALFLKLDRIEDKIDGKMDKHPAK
jgi:hypothetical protein